MPVPTEEASGRKETTARHLNFNRAQVVDNLAQTFAVIRIALEVTLVLLDDAAVGVTIDIVDRLADGWRTTGDHGRFNAVGCNRKIGADAEAAVALPQQSPARVAEQFTPDQLSIAHNGVGPEVSEIVGLGPGRIEVGQRLEGQRRAAPGAALVQQQHAIVLQGQTQPAGDVLRARRRRARSALQEDQPGQVIVCMGRCHDLAGVDRNSFALGLVMNQGQVKLVIRHREAGQVIGTHNGQTPHFN